MKSQFSSYLQICLNMEVVLKPKLARMFPKYFKLVNFYIFFLLLIFCSRPAVSFSVIKSLPGFSAPLPFKLETGYIGVGDVEFFYYFIESESDPAEDPLVLWLTGGPGCTALSGLFLEIGPLQFNMVEYNGSLPTLALNPYSWTKVANIIFIDAPVGTGFTYSRTLQGFKTSDTKHAKDSYNFLRKWLQSHPKFIKNPLYIAGDSYSGIVVPIIAQEISDGIEDRSIIPAMNLKGYVLGNPGTDLKIDGNSKIPFYHRTALISDQLYESAKRSCKEEYTEVDVSNVKCAMDLQAISECVARINGPHILEPKCPSDFTQSNPSENNRKYFLETYGDSLDLPTAEFPQFGCRNYNCYLLAVWATDINVQEAIHVRKGTVRDWVRCNQSLDYDNDVESTLSYHLYLNTRGYRALIYSGDHDSDVPYVGTESWIRSLNFSIVDAWRPWMVDDQVGGYSTEFENNFTFATVKGGGHTAPEFKPKECYTMFKRWISQQPL